MKPAEVYQEILKADLHRTAGFDTLSESEFVQIYEKNGPDSWYDNLKDLMTWVYRNMQSIIAVYDIEFYFNDGTRNSWERSLDDWRFNIPVILNYRYPLWKIWLIPRRIFVWRKIKTAYMALQDYSSENSGDGSEDSGDGPEKLSDCSEKPVDGDG